MTDWHWREDFNHRVNIAVIKGIYLVVKTSVTLRTMPFLREGPYPPYPISCMAINTGIPIEYR